MTYARVSGFQTYRVPLNVLLGGAPPVTTSFSPPPGSVLSSSTVTFSWNVSSATAYWLIVGKSRGASDIFNSGQTGGHMFTVNNIPTDGRPIYVRLWSYTGGQWNAPEDFAYVAQRFRPTAPVIGPAGGTFSPGVRVAIACATPGATIYYTTNGTNPTTASNVYRSAIVLDRSTTIKAKAVKAGLSADSLVTTATFIIR